MFVESILFVILLYVAASVISGLSGLYDGFDNGCYKKVVPHTFESRIDYLFPAHDLVEQYSSIGFRGSKLCNIPKWLTSPIYLNE